MKLDTLELESFVSDYILENDTATGTILNSFYDNSMLSAATEYVRHFTFHISQEADSDSVSLLCEITYPSIDSIEESLASSQTFLEEYEASTDKTACIWNYVTNSLLSEISLQYNTEKITVSAVDQTTASDNLADEADKFVAEHLSAFALTKFYEGGNKTKTADEIICANNLNDFVFKIRKHKILVSNIDITSGDDAINKLCDLSANNTAVVTDPLETCIYVIEYTVTNLTPKPVMLENYFYLGDVDGCLYHNTGFHIEGLSMPVELAFGESHIFTTAVVGNAESVLYFYDVDMYGARQWREIPLSNNQAEQM